MCSAIILQIIFTKFVSILELQICLRVLLQPRTKNVHAKIMPRTVSARKSSKAYFFNKIIRNDFL
jgi:hypothetical protein